MNSGLRLLLVDDNPADIGLAREALAESAHHSEITSLENGTDAIAFLNRGGKYADAVLPDLVILDLSLPGCNGMTILETIKTGPQLRRIPVVMFSTSRLSRDIVRCYELGASCYISKPGNLNDYLSAVKSIENFWCGFACLPPKGE
ncbi:MAG TPA: response regulator [Candidatus Aquilonibacter sp.]|nr:response regulator [Candidatus Aquilonibacter sp.]